MHPPPGLRPLLSSFPSPPSHIPSSPASAFRSYFPANDQLLNPPPSGPPTAPLPPVPEGPSKVTEEDHMAFLNMRRTSSYAASTTSSRRSSRFHSRKSSKNSSSSEDSPTIPSDAQSQQESAQADTPTLSRDEIFSHQQQQEPLPDTPVTPTHPRRPSSPDITTLIQRARSSTPRRSRSSHSSGTRRPVPGIIKRLRSTPALGGVAAPAPGFYPSSRPDASPFPTQLTTGTAPPQEEDDPEQDSWEEPDPAWEEEDVWEEQDPAEVDDVVGEEEDVIDLRTPLPHLMLRAGLLSPHSKLLPRPAPSPEPPSPVPTQPPESAGRKSAPLRDERDTVKRRQRHKDGKLLRGGIGLTTGLGWSDSEDEDAPSALTHRLSRLAPTLSRKSSMASSLASSTTTTSSAPSSFSRAAVSVSVSRSGSNSSVVSRAGSTLPYLEKNSNNNNVQDIPQLPAPPAYPYTFRPPSPSDSGHGHGLGQTVFYHRAGEDRSPTPTTRNGGAGGGGSVSVPSTPLEMLRSPLDTALPSARPPLAVLAGHVPIPPRTRPPSKALPPLPTALPALPTVTGTGTGAHTGIPKTASLSSLQGRLAAAGMRAASVSSYASGANGYGYGVRARTASNASTGTAGTGTGMGVGARGVVPLKSAIKSAGVRA